LCLWGHLGLEVLADETQQVVRFTPWDDIAAELAKA